MLFTNRYNIKKFYFLPRQCVYVLCPSQKNSDYIPTQYKLISFVIETECIYCDVLTVFLNRG